MEPWQSQQEKARWQGTQLATHLPQSPQTGLQGPALISKVDQKRAEIGQLLPEASLIRCELYPSIY